MELIHAMVERYKGISVFAGVGERSREGHEMLLDMRTSGVLERTVLVYGQMNEPPGARWRVPLTALTIAEYFRDERHQNVLLLMDNVFRFVQAGSEVSGLLGRLPSRVGYQPTLASEVAALQERIVSVGGVSVTAIEAVYVPADDFTDPAVTTIAAHIDSMVVLSRQMAAEGMYPAIDPIASSSILLDPLVVGKEHAAVATEVRRNIEHYRELQDVISLLGIEELGAEDRRIVERARRLQRFLTQPFTVTEAFSGVPGRSVAVADTIAGCKAILAGDCDEWQESSKPGPYRALIGTIFIFILVANWSSLIPGVEAPTAHLETDAAFGAIVFFSTIFYGVRVLGLPGYLATFTRPTWVMIPLNIVEQVTRTFSLIVRLFGNIMSGVFIGAIVLSLAGLFVPIPFMALDVLTGAIQAYIFIVLAMVYIGAALAESRQESPTTSKK